MTIEQQREAFYGRADTQHLAPLWTRLKSLVPEAPAPVGRPSSIAFCIVIR